MTLVYSQVYSNIYNIYVNENTLAYLVVYFFLYDGKTKYRYISVN